MIAPKPMTVEDRLARLERENRRLKLAAVALIVVFAAGAAEEKIPNEISARKFTVVTPDNDVRITLGFNEKDGSAGLLVSQPKKGGPAARVGFNPNGYGELVLFDTDGRPVFDVPSK